MEGYIGEAVGIRKWWYGGGGGVRREAVGDITAIVWRVDCLKLEVCDVVLHRAIHLRKTMRTEVLADCPALSEEKADGNVGKWTYTLDISEYLGTPFQLTFGDNVRCFSSGEYGLRDFLRVGEVKNHGSIFVDILSRRHCYLAP